MQFNLIKNTEMLVFLCIWVYDGTVCLLALSSFRYTCTGSLKVMRSQSFGYLLFLKRLFSALVLFLFFCFPPTTPPFFSSFHCYHSVTGARMSLCGAHAWFGGNASHGSVLLSSGWLITVEALGDPGHPPSTRLDAVVK